MGLQMIREKVPPLLKPKKFMLGWSILEPGRLEVFVEIFDTTKLSLLLTIMWRKNAMTMIVKRLFELNKLNCVIRFSVILLHES